MLLMGFFFTTLLISPLLKGHGLSLKQPEFSFSKDAYPMLWAVWLKLAQWFWRRLKCKKSTDSRTTNNRISEKLIFFGFWPTIHVPHPPFELEKIRNIFLNLGKKLFLSKPDKIVKYKIMSSFCKWLSSNLLKSLGFFHNPLKFFSDFHILNYHVWQHFFWYNIYMYGMYQRNLSSTIIIAVDGETIMTVTMKASTRNKMHFIY